MTFLNKQGGIKTDQSSVTVGPTYLIDCSNIVFSREDWLESRHGHQVRYFYSDYANNPTNAAISSIALYETPFRRYTTTVGSYTNLVRCVGLMVDDTVTPPHKITLGQANISELPTQAINFSVYTGGSFGQTPLISYGYTPNTLVNKYPVGFKFKNNYYWLTNTGLYWPSRGFSDLTANPATKVQTPELTAIAASCTTSATVDENFLIPGYKIGIAVVTILDVGDLNSTSTVSTKERFIESAPIFGVLDETFINVNSNPSNFLTVDVTTRVKMTSSVVTPLPFVAAGRVKLRVYRTRQIPVYGTAFQENGTLSYAANPLPVEYYQAGPDIEVIPGTTTYTTRLTTNDDGIISLPELYTNPNIEGLQNANTFVRGAKNVTEYKNYHIYSNFNDPGIKTLTLTGQTGTASFALYYRKSNEVYQDTNSRRLRDASFTRPTNSTTPPIVSVSQTFISPGRTDLTYTGFSSAATRFLIYPNDLRGGVKPYAKITNIAASGAGVTVTGVAGQFDLTKFTAPGIAAHVFQNGEIRNMFYYKSVSKTAADTYVFNEATFAGSLLAVFGPNDYLYFIPGESMASLPVYAISGNPIDANVNNFATVSLLPGQGCPSTPIGLVSSSSSTGTYPWARTADGLVSQIFYLGVLKRSPAELLDRAIITLISDLNDDDTSNRFTIRKSPEIGQFYVTPNDQSFEFVTFTCTSPATFLPALPTTFSSTATDYIESKNFKNTLQISKLNTPEVVAESMFFSPIEVGDRNEAIQATVANTDNLFILKENTIWRLSISGQSSIPEIDSITLFDPTTGCAAGRSAQAVNEEIIWLSPKGFVSISGNNSEFIGRDIEQETRTALSLCQGAGLTDRIVAFGNRSKRLYGCFIPTGDNPLTGVTYVFDCYLRKWSKWDLPFEFAEVDSTGKLYSIQSFWNGSEFRYSTLREDEFTNGASDAAVDQYDADLSLNGATVTAVVGNVATLTRGFGDLYGWASPASTAVNTIKGLGESVIPYLGKNAYYKIGSTFYAITIERTSATEISITFAETPPITAGQNVSTHSLVLGVVATARYQPETGASPSTLKQFQEYHVHTANAVHNLGLRYTTDSRSTDTAWREFTSYSATRTVYRAYLPIEASRGRFLIREIRHYYPGEKFEMVGQEHIFREIGSVRNQKAD